MERDSNGKIDRSKFNLEQAAPSVDIAIKVIEANFIEPLFSLLTTELNQSIVRKAMQNYPIFYNITFRVCDEFDGASKLDEYFKSITEKYIN